MYEREHVTCDVLVENTIVKMSSLREGLAETHLRTRGEGPQARRSYSTRSLALVRASMQGVQRGLGGSELLNTLVEIGSHQWEFAFSTI
jgi:hypothetical protein